MTWLRGVAGAALLAFGMWSCATTVSGFDDDEGSTTITTGGGGGIGGASTSTGVGGSTMNCAVDCSSIATPDCQVAQCNNATGQCEIVPESDGASCDDGVFCSVDDACVAGACVGGPQNDCGMSPPACTEVTCDEVSQTCSTAPAMNGAACQGPDLCTTGSSCNNGLCLGGSPNDCFFFPVSDDCHVAACNPMNGMCEEQVGNEGLPCTDLTDLCTDNKTCMAGVCQGGAPKNCSSLTQGCQLGVCDVATGQCIAQNLMNGDPCDDLNPCTNGESCQSGQCNNGTPITACVNNDSCCPMGCTSANDAECGHADCTDLTTNAPVWGQAAVGLDLRQWTSNFMWLGCAFSSCTTSTWYCNYDPVNQILQFGSASGTVRALIDPNNTLNGQFPTTYNSCCTSSIPTDVCNAPDNVDGPAAVNSADALCEALGYQTGQLVSAGTGNTCPEVFASDTTGLNWSSDFVSSNGYGQQWQCSTFK